MKNNLKISFVICCLLLGNLAVKAQDWVKVAPKGKVIKTENSVVRVIEVTMLPGESEAMHTHPAHVYYALSEGKLKVSYSDGKSETYDLKPGDGAYSEPERPHTTENVGKNTIKFLIVELKEHPFKQ